MFFFYSFKTPLVHSIASIELKPDVKLSDFSSLLNSSQMLEEEQVMVVEKPPRSKKSLLAYPDAPKLKLKQSPKDLPCASIEPHATSTVEVPSKMSADQKLRRKVRKPSSLRGIK